jgi:hypothetical protein
MAAHFAAWRMCTLLYIRHMSLILQSLTGATITIELNWAIY